MDATKNDLPRETRHQVIDILDGRLAEGIDLYNQLKQAHWNVKGPNFIALHGLFDQVAGIVLGFNDDIAERIVQLGGTAIGTVRSVGRKSALAEYPSDIVDGSDHVEAVSSALASFGAAVRASIGRAERYGDADTADLFTEISRALDKQLWFVEAHNQGRGKGGGSAAPTGRAARHVGSDA